MTTAPATEPEQRYEFDDGKSQKFWTISLDGTSHTVQYGRIGTDGQTKTKEFDSEDEARKSYDKLIAQKTKKGYELVGGSGGAKPKGTKKAATKTTSSAAKSSTKKATGSGKSAKKSEPAEASADTSIRRDLGLAEADLRFATWREFPVLPKPEVVDEFDEARFEKRLKRVKSTCYGWDWDFEKVDFGGPISRREALAWVHVMTCPHDRTTTAADVAPKELKQVDATLDALTLEDARTLLARYERTVDDGVVRFLAVLFDLESLVELIVTPFEISANSYGWSNYDRWSWVAPQLALAFNRSVLPMLNKTECSNVAKWIRPAVKKAAPVATAQGVDKHAPEVYLAAGLGMHREVKAFVEKLEDDRYAGESGGWRAKSENVQYLLFGLPSAEETVSEWRRLNAPVSTPEHIRGFLACTEFRAPDVVAEWICRETNKKDATALAKEFARATAPEMAEPMLRLMLESKASPVAREWLLENVGNGVAGLVEVVARKGAFGDAAVQYLRDVKARGHADVIEKALEGKPAEGGDRVRQAVLDHEEKVYEPFNAKSTPKWLAKALADAEGEKWKQPKWLRVEDLPPVVVGEKRFDDEQLTTLLAVLSKAALPEGDPLLRELREKGDRAALDAFAWRLFELWTTEGAPSKEKWAMTSTGFLGSDETVLKLTPLIRKWPGESQHKRAVLGLECLRAIGSDTALMELNGIAQKVKFQGLKKQARAFMQEIADEKGLTREQLEDRVVPDLGLDEKGTRVFDFGERAFRFALTPEMKPAVRDDEGKLRKDLPKPAGKDDAKKAEQAVADWKLLKKQLRETIKIQVPRLEQAMVTGRRWSVSEFETLLVRQPLMTNLVRTVLWGGYDAKGKLVKLFRVTEEQDYADEKDETTKLQGVDTVGIVHPLLITEKQAATWGELFSDYEIVSPFPQLGRDTYSLEKGETKDKEIARFDGVKLPPTSLVGTLERLGWVRGPALDGGCFHEHSKSFPGSNVTAVVHYEEGIPMGYMEGWDDQKLRGCYFLKGLSGSADWNYPDPRKGLALGKVDAIAISEVIGDLNVLASKGTK